MLVANSLSQPKTQVPKLRADRKKKEKNEVVIPELDDFWKAKGFFIVMCGLYPRHQNLQ